MFLSLNRKVKAQTITQPAIDSFRLDGQFSGSKTTSVSISYLNWSGENIQQKSNIVNGRFHFKGQIAYPTQILLKGNIDSIDWTGDPNSLTLIIEPAKMHLQLQEDHFKEARLIGSSTQSQYDSLQLSEKPIQNHMEPFTVILGHLNDSLGIAFKLKDSTRIADIMDKRAQVFKNLQPYQRQLKTDRLNFIRSNTGSYLSAYLLYYNFMNEDFTRDSLQFYLSRLEPPIQNSYWAKKCRIWLNYKKLTPLGSTLPYLGATDINGQKVHTNDLIKNQPYTLVIFWASWCPPCRAMTPTYRAIYQKYHSKGLNVLAITEDFHQNLWRSAIQKDVTATFKHIVTAQVYI